MGKKKILSKGGATLYFHFQKLAELLGLASHLFCNKSMEFLCVGDCGVQQESNTRKNYILKPQNAIMCTNFVYFCVHHQHIIALFLPRSQAAKHRGPLTFHSMYCVHTWLYLLCSRKYLKKKSLFKQEIKHYRQMPKRQNLFVFEWFLMVGKTRTRR